MRNIVASITRNRKDLLLIPLAPALMVRPYPGQARLRKRGSHFSYFGRVGPESNNWLKNPGSGESGTVSSGKGPRFKIFDRI